MKQIFVTLACFLSFVITSAIEWNPYLLIDILDSYTHELVMDAQVDLLRPDSTLIKTYWTNEAGTAFNRQINLSIDSIPRTGGFLYVTHEGYYPVYVKIPKLGPREDFAYIRPIMLRPKPFFKPKELKEITVTASKVKMVVRGDTIIYNADAFALAEGSMLDGLIEQLPGAELKRDGRIMVNGQFVSELLVNGDNFFRGDPKIALENLPAYMVNDIKVFHRNDFHEDKPLNELPLVMDVRLKKQYRTGWIANAEAGYGTANRYLGRLFGMLFTPDSRLAIVGNINNTNDDRKPGQTDNWNPNWQSAGQARNITGGLDYTWNSRLREWKIEANLMAKEKKSLIETSSVSERYLEGGNIFARSKSSADSRQFRISSDNRIQLLIPRLQMNLIPKFSYSRTKTNEDRQSTTETVQTLLNSLDETGLVYNKIWTVGTGLNGYWQLPLRPELLKFDASVNWTKSNRESTRLRELLFPEQSNLREISAPQEFMPERTLSASANLSYSSKYYDSQFLHSSFRADYSYNHSTVHNTRDYYLRQTAEDALPSVSEAAMNAGFVPSNSYDYVMNEDKHSLRFYFSSFVQHYLDKGERHQPFFDAEVNVHYDPGHMTYTQVGQTYSAKRHTFYVDPKISLGLSNIGQISYKYSSMLPSLMNLLDVTDAANPLYIYLGNSDLKPTRNHEIALSLFSSVLKYASLEVAYNRYENMIAQSAVYDMTTGVTTYKPVNINGNWTLSGNLKPSYSFERQFRDKKWQPDFELRALYQNSVDLIGMDLSTVRNFNLGGKLKFTYKIMDGMEVAANGNAEWRKVTSPMEDFNPISAVDFDYGITFRAVKLPYNISVTTDLMMHSRRGYNDSQLNTNDLVWNARVSKSILHGNLIFALDGFDILGQLSNVRLTMNSQGRTEARYNTVPRYAMLHIIYRLNIKPKKNK